MIFIQGSVRKIQEYLTSKYMSRESLESYAPNSWSSTQHEFIWSNVVNVELRVRT